MKIHIAGSSGIRYGGKFLKLEGYKIYYISSGKIKTVHKDNVIFNYKPEFDPLW